MTAALIIVLVANLLAVFVFLQEIPEFKKDYTEFHKELKDKEVYILMDGVFITGLLIVLVLLVDQEKVIYIHHIYATLCVFMLLSILLTFRLFQKKVPERYLIKNRTITFLIYCLFLFYLFSIEY